MGYDNLSNLKGDITSSDDEKQLLFVSNDIEYPLQLTPLYRLLHRNIEAFINYL